MQADILTESAAVTANRMDRTSSGQVYCCGADTIHLLYYTHTSSSPSCLPSVIIFFIRPIDPSATSPIPFKPKIPGSIYLLSSHSGFW